MHPPLILEHDTSKQSISSVIIVIWSFTIEIAFFDSWKILSQLYFLALETEWSLKLHLPFASSKFFIEINISVPFGKTPKLFWLYIS